MLYKGRKVCQPCTLVQGEVRGKRKLCEFCEYSVRERGGSEGTAVWGSDKVPCPMNTDCGNDADSSCYMCAGMYTVYLNKSVLVEKIPPEAWTTVYCECYMFSGRVLCDELITRPEESYRL